MKVTYIGHASVLMEHGGRSMIADPVFSKRLATFFTRRLGELRFDPCTIRGLRAILISHGHHDHMDLRSLSALGKEVPVIVPKGASFPLRVRGYRDIRTTAPWQESVLGDATVTTVPAHHFGGRPPFYVGAGFQGYVVSDGAVAYFAGDTGMDAQMFREIGRRFSLDVALLPIGAYHPPSFRKYHMSPEDALEAFRLLGAKKMVPIHFETYSLSMEPLGEPRKRLLAEAERLGVSDKLTVLESGQSTEI